MTLELRGAILSLTASALLAPLSPQVFAADAFSEAIQAADEAAAVREVEGGRVAVNARSSGDTATLGASSSIFW